MKVRHIGLITENLPSSLEFWGDLGFLPRVSLDENAEYISALIGKKINGLTTVKLSSGIGCEIDLQSVVPTASHSTDNQMVFGINHIAMTFSDLSEVEKIVAKHGFKMLSDSIQHQEEAKVKVCYFEIHDGILLEAVQDL